MVGAGDVAGAAGTSAHTGGGFDHSADHLRILAHAKVIVRTPDHDWMRAIRGMPCCVREPPGDTLEIGKDAVAPLVVQAGKRDGKEMIIDHRAMLSGALSPKPCIRSAHCSPTTAPFTGCSRANDIS